MYKIKAAPVHATNACGEGVGGSRGITPIIINLDTRRGGQFYAPRPIYPERKISGWLIK